MKPISVIIPSYNRPRQLRFCLESFQSQAYSSEWEIIVVNDGGEQSFAGLPEDLCARLPLRLVDAPHRGPASARNLGASLAQGQYLAFTDDDCMVAPDWLYQMAQGLSKSDKDGLSGRTLNPYPQNTAAVAWQLYLEFLQEQFRDAHGNLLMLLSNNAVYRREAFDAVGGFDTSFPLAAGEDLELNYRLVAHGYRLGYWGEAALRHNHRTTALAFLRQQYLYGRGSIYLDRALLAHPRRVILRSEGNFYKALLLYLWRQRAPLRAMLLIYMLFPCYHLGRRSESRRISKTSGSTR